MAVNLYLLGNEENGSKETGVHSIIYTVYIYILGSIPSVSILLLACWNGYHTARHWVTGEKSWAKILKLRFAPNSSNMRTF